MTEMTFMRSDIYFSDKRFRHLFTIFDVNPELGALGWMITEWMGLDLTWPARSRLECAVVCRRIEGCIGTKFTRPGNICFQVMKKNVDIDRRFQAVKLMGLIGGL